MCFYTFYPSHPFFGTCEASHQGSPKPEASGPNHQPKWAKQNPVGYLGLFRLLDLTIVLNKSLSIGFMYLSVNQPLGALLKQNQLHKMLCFGIVLGASTQNKESLALAYSPRCSFRDPSDVRSIVESRRFRDWKVMWNVPWHVWKAIISCCLIWLDGRWCWCERCRILLRSFLTDKWGFCKRILNVKAQSSWLIVKLHHLAIQHLLSWKAASFRTPQVQPGLGQGEIERGREFEGFHVLKELVLFGTKTGLCGKWLKIHLRFCWIALFFIFCIEWCGASAWCLLSICLKKEPLK